MPPPPPDADPDAPTRRVFRAATLREALVQVRDALGADAVVVQQRRLRRRGVLGIGAREVCEVTAEPARRRPPRPASAALRSDIVGSPVDDADQQAREALQATLRRIMGQTAPPQQQGAEADLSSRLDRPSSTSTDIDGGPGPANAPTRSPLPRAAGDLIRRTYAPDGPPATRSRQHPEPDPDAPDPTTQRLVAEVAELRALIERLTDQAAVQSRVPEQTPKASAPNDADALARLIEQEVAEELAVAVLAEGHAPDATADDPSFSSDTDAHAVAQASLVQRLRGLTADASATLQTVSTLVLVGPTGVGKTTTLAKLAALARLRYGREVGLLTLDTFRIAAADQLRVYADILDAPMETAHSPDDAKVAVHRLRARGAELVLVDTAGRSPADAAGIDEVRRQLQPLDADAVHLVLSSAGSLSATRRVGEAFRGLGLHRLIFTKIDEAESHGVLLNAADALNLPLAYLGTGQAVPDDLIPASPEAVARLILDGPSAVCRAGLRPQPARDAPVAGPGPRQDPTPGADLP